MSGASAVCSDRAIPFVLRYWKIELNVLSLNHNASCSLISKVDRPGAIDGNGDVPPNKLSRSGTIVAPLGHCPHTPLTSVPEGGGATMTLDGPSQTGSLSDDVLNAAAMTESAAPDANAAL